MGKRNNIKYRLFIFIFAVFYCLNILTINNAAPNYSQSQRRNDIVKGNGNVNETKEKIVANINNQMNRVKGQVILNDIYIKFKSNDELNNIKKVLDKNNFKIKVSYQLKDELKDGYQRGVIRIANKTKVKEAVKYLNNLSNVAYAEPNYKYKAAFIPSDNDYRYQWNLDTINAPSAWDITKGSSSIIIAVLDTGIDFSHPELKDHILSSGYDYVNNDRYPGDDNGHGTMVAGVIGAKMNGSGIVGIDCPARILPIKVLDRYGSGYTQSIARGIVYAVNRGAKIINLSLAGPYYSQGVKDAISYAHSKGRIVIAASGNDGEHEITYPAAYPYVIAVGATDSDDQLSSFSNYGSYVDVVAPGEDIFTTAPLYHTYLNQYNYALADGTSFAAPQVSALAGLILSLYPNLSPDQVEGMIKGGAKDIGPKGKDMYYGYGRIDLYRSFVDKYEPNFNQDHGAIIPIGQSVQANFVPARDSDYYKYYIKQGYKFNISVTPAEGTNIVIRLYNNAGSLIKTINQYGDGKAESGSVIQTEDGYINVQVFDYRGRIIRKNYILKTSKDDIYENNNTQLTAYYLKNLPSQFNAQISGKNDIDWYKFMFNRGGELKVDLTNYSNAAGWHLELYNKNNKIIYRTEQGSDFTGASTFKLDNGGTYYLKLYNNNGVDVIKDYRLGVNYAEKDIYEPNDNINNIVSNSVLEIKNGQPIIGNFHANGDIDYYYFNSAGPGVFNFNLEFPYGMVPEVNIYNSTNLSKPFYSSLNLNRIITDQVKIDQAGSYIVLIKPYNNYTSTNNYTFTGNYTINN